MFARTTLLNVLAVAAAGCVHASHEDHPHGNAPHWGYDGEAGPARWGQLAGEYKSCATGDRQSPVALATERAEVANLPPLAFHYGATAIVEVNNGHTIQDQIPAGEHVELAGARYQLEQFHFHHPSEHTLDGVSYPLEIHFVHRDPAGALLVVGVLVAEGAAHPALDVLFAKLPHEHEQARHALDPASLVPADHRYFTYDGSLTTPPCSEGVTWIVLATPITASAAQLERFATLFPHNNRPVMPLHGRRVRTTPAP